MMQTLYVFSVFRVRVEVDRLGGGFGGKILNNCLVASACGLAAYVTNRYI